jgi:peptidoglycan hydrolase-like protein with peptidoglycan-binding domain
MAEALATGNASRIRLEAAKLRLEGFASEASELEKAAAVLDPPVVVKPATPTAPAVVVKPAPPATPATVPVPGQPWLKGVPPELQGVTLRRVDKPAADPRVKLVQERLVALGYPVSPVDGKFGPGTETQVKAFQSSNGLSPVDGIVGKNTLLALASSSAKGPKGAAPAPAVKPAPAPAVKPAPAPAPAVKPAPAPAVVAPAGRAPTITAALRNLPSLLKNDGKFKAPTSAGQAVTDWQQVLFDLGFLKAKPDGKYGKDSEAATKAFQTAANSAAKKSGKPLLTVDGIVGPASVARAAEARIMTTGAAAFTGDRDGFGDDPFRAPSSPLADTPLPGLIPDMLPTGPDPRRALASRLLNMLVHAPRGREDRTLVSLFQVQENLRPTGFYGPAVALRLAQGYGIVPPKPLHWTESRTSKSKQNYRDALRVLAERDPQRAEEWNRAAEV